MKRALLVIASLWLSVPTAAENCREDTKAVISAEQRCVKDGGIEIGYYEDGGMKVACMESRKVQNTCGPDGRLTRMHAFAAWLDKLKSFESNCLERGGTFHFADASFTEPTDESFCLQAQPEIGANMFEEPLCNFRSVCPSVAVTCDFPCSGAPDLPIMTFMPEPSLADLRR